MATLADYICWNLCDSYTAAVCLICALTCKQSVMWLILPMCECMCKCVHIDFELHCVVTII